nr:restriction endonuclease subunit S [uncultured Flavobacterium sp.]
MSLSFKFIPLTFLNDENEIKKQIRNTIILKYFFERNSAIVQLEDIITGTKYGYNASALVQGRNKFLRISDITDGKVNWKTVPYCNCSDEETYLLFPNDILIARTGGTTGKSFLIYDPPALSIYAGYLIRIRANEETNPDYLNLFLNSYVYWSQIVSLNEDNFRPSVNAEKLKKLILPKCDPNDQRDAVKISNGEIIYGYDDLYQLIDETILKYDKLKEIQIEKRNQLNLHKALKQSILSEAIQGKLTDKWREENPTIEVASKLLESIKKEKTQLIKDKKLKKEKDLLPIKLNEVPFDLPESWVWCRLGDLVTILGDGLHGTPNYSEKGDYFFINGNNLINGKIEVKNTTKRISFEEFEKYKKLMNSNTVLVSINGTLGNLAFFENEKIILGKSACYFNLFDQINKYYIGHLIKSKYFLKYAVDVASETTIKNVSLKSMREFPIPLPPLYEQEQIIAKIEDLMIFSEELEQNINESLGFSEKLMKEVLKEAFEVKEYV